MASVAPASSCITLVIRHNTKANSQHDRVSLINIHYLKCYVSENLCHSSVCLKIQTSINSCDV